MIQATHSSMPLNIRRNTTRSCLDPLSTWVVAFLCVLMAIPPEAVQAAMMTDIPVPSCRDTYTAGPACRSGQTPETVPAGTDIHLRNDSSASHDKEVYLDAETLLRVPEEEADTTKTIVADPNSPYGLDGKIKFNPSPERAVWLSALFPGLGQIYNRHYWKLPIIVGGFMGLGYATSWNNSQLQDYTQGYRDLIDNDPATKSYMNFFPPNTDESSLDKSWLQSTMRSRRNFYRRNRDLCIIFIVALYLLCMVDAYVDASMAHFDISPNLSMDVAPAMMVSPGSRRPALGLNWAFNF